MIRVNSTFYCLDDEEISSSSLSEKLFQDHLNIWPRMIIIIVSVDDDNVKMLSWESKNPKSNRYAYIILLLLAVCVHELINCARRTIHFLSFQMSNQL